MNLKKLVNKGIDGLSPYEPNKPIEDLEEARYKKCSEACAMRIH